MSRRTVKFSCTCKNYFFLFSLCWIIFKKFSIESGYERGRCMLRCGSWSLIFYYWFFGSFCYISIWIFELLGTFLLFIVGRFDLFKLDKTVGYMAVIIGNLFFILFSLNISKVRTWNGLDQLWEVFRVMLIWYFMDVGKRWIKQFCHFLWVCHWFFLFIHKLIWGWLDQSF